MGTYLTKEEILKLANAPHDAVHGWNMSSHENAKLKKKIKNLEDTVKFWCNMNDSPPAALKVIYTTLFNPNNDPNFGVPRGERGMVMKKNLSEKRRKVNKMIARGRYTVEPSSDEEE